MASVYKHNGKEHIFTNRSESDIITLRAGRGETLHIEGTVSNYTDFPILDTINYDSVTTTTAYDARVDRVGAVGPLAQGHFVHLDISTSTSGQLFAGSKSTDFIDFQASIFDLSSSSATSNLSLTSSVLTAEEPSHSTLEASGSIYGNTLSLNNLENNPEQFPSYVYKRSGEEGTSWTLAQTILDTKSAKTHLFNNDILMQGSHLGNARVYNRPTNADNFTEQQVLSHYTTNVLKGACIYSDYIAIVDNATTLRFYYRSAGTWSLVESSGDTGYLRCVMSGDYLVVSKGAELIVYTYTSAGFSQRYTITESSTCVDLSLYNSNLVVLDSTGIKFYKLFDDIYDYDSANSVAIASATGISINNLYVAVGLPASESGEGNTAVYPITYGDGTLSNSIISTSGSMSISTPSLYITGETQVTASDNASVVMLGGVAINKNLLVSGTVTTSALSVTNSVTATGTVTDLRTTGTVYNSGRTLFDVMEYVGTSQSVSASTSHTVKWGPTSSALSMSAGVIGTFPTNTGLSYNSGTGVFTNNSGSTKCFMVQCKFLYFFISTSGYRYMSIISGSNELGLTSSSISGTADYDSLTAVVPLANGGTFHINVYHTSSGGDATSSGLSRLQIIPL